MSKKKDFLHIDLIWLVVFGMALLAVIVILDKPPESQALFADIVKVLSGGLLGYIVRQLEDIDDENNNS